MISLHLEEQKEGWDSCSLYESLIEGIYLEVYIYIHVVFAMFCKEWYGTLSPRYDWVFDSSVEVWCFSRLHVVAGSNPCA